MLCLEIDTAVANIKLIGPLTPREVEILRLIAGGKSNGEIASALYLAVCMVKRHINHIFGTHGVSARAQANAMARDQAFV